MSAKLFSFLFLLLPLYAIFFTPNVEAHFRQLSGPAAKAAAKAARAQQTREVQLQQAAAANRGQIWDAGRIGILIATIAGLRKAAERNDTALKADISKLTVTIKTLEGERRLLIAQITDLTNEIVDLRNQIIDPLFAQNELLRREKEELLQEHCDELARLRDMLNEKVAEGRVLEQAIAGVEEEITTESQKITP